MYLDLVELYIAKQAKRKQKEDFLVRYSEEWAVKGGGLRARRREYGLLAGVVAEEIGISTNTLRNFERGIYVRNVRIIKLAYERILCSREERDESSRLSNEIQQLRRQLAHRHQIIIEVDGERFDFLVDSKVQPQHQRTRRSVI